MIEVEGVMKLAGGQAAPTRIWGLGYEGPGQRSVIDNGDDVATVISSCLYCLMSCQG